MDARVRTFQPSVARAERWARRGEAIDNGFKLRLDDQVKKVPSSVRGRSRTSEGATGKLPCHTCVYP